MDDHELSGCLERLDELLDLYELLTPYWKACVEQEVRAVVLALLGLSEDPPTTWTL